MPRGMRAAGRGAIDRPTMVPPRAQSWDRLSHQFGAEPRTVRRQPIEQHPVRGVELVAAALHAELDMPAVLRVIDARQAEYLDAVEPGLDALHQRRQRRLHRAEHDHRLLLLRALP